MGDIDTVLVDSLKALDPERPIREADIDAVCRQVRFRSAFPRDSRGESNLTLSHQSPPSFPPGALNSVTLKVLRARRPALAVRATALFAKRGRQIVGEGARGGFGRTTCREDGVEFVRFHLPVGQHLHERAARELRTAVPQGH